MVSYLVSCNGKGCRKLILIQVELHTLGLQAQLEEEGWFRQYPDSEPACKRQDLCPECRITTPKEPIKSTGWSRHSRPSDQEPGRAVRALARQKDREMMGLKAPKEPVVNPHIGWDYNSPADHQPGPGYRASRAWVEEGEKTRPKLKTLKEHNDEVRLRREAKWRSKGTPNGIACPKCGAELLDTKPNRCDTRQGQQAVHCLKCDFQGWREA